MFSGYEILRAWCRLSVRMVFTSIACFFLYSASTALAQDIPQNINIEEEGFPISSCVQLAALEDFGRMEVLPEKKAAEKHPVVKELLLPMTEADLKNMVRSLQPVNAKDKNKNKKIWGIQAITEGITKPQLERMALVMGDATTLLAKLHTEEALARLKKIPNVNKATLKWIENANTALSFCAQRRFEGRGGQATYNDTLVLVKKYRKQLEPVILLNRKAQRSAIQPNEANVSFQVAPKVGAKK